MLVVTDVRERVTEYELHDLAVAPADDKPENHHQHQHIFFVFGPHLCRRKVVCYFSERSPEWAKWDLRRQFRDLQGRASRKNETWENIYTNRVVCVFFLKELSGKIGCTKPIWLQPTATAPSSCHWYHMIINTYLQISSQVSTDWAGKSVSIELSNHTHHTRVRVICPFLNYKDGLILPSHTISDKFIHKHMIAYIN